MQPYMDHLALNQSQKRNVGAGKNDPPSAEVEPDATGPQTPIMQADLQDIEKWEKGNLEARAEQARAFNKDTFFRYFSQTNWS